MINWAKLTGFQWDNGNSRKSVDKHGVGQSEVEQIFFNEPLMNKSTKIPEFKSEAEERHFWENTDSSDYLDWNKAQIVSLPNLKPSTKTISLRLPETLLDRIKIEANRRDIPYQSLIKAWLMEDVKR